MSTASRSELNVVELLAHWQPTVIKGNAAEIGALAESTEVSHSTRHPLIFEVASRGVDSLGSGFADPAGVVRNLARKRGKSFQDVQIESHSSSGDNSPHWGIRLYVGWGNRAQGLQRPFIGTSKLTEDLS